MISSSSSVYCDAKRPRHARHAADRVSGESIDVGLIANYNGRSMIVRPATAVMTAGGIIMVVASS